MAALANSTPMVAPHGPVTAAIRAMREPEPTPDEGRGCLVLDNALVFFDSRRRPTPGDMILIARRDGTLDVVMLPEQHRDVSPTVPGPGVVYVLKKGEQFGRHHCREQVAFVGAVTTAAGRSIRSDQADAYERAYAGR